MLIAFVRSALALVASLAMPVLWAMLLLVPCFMVLSFWWAGQNDAHRLSLVPPGFAVTRTIDYAYGGGGVPLPSDKGNGLVLYELPRDTADRIADRGIGELTRLSRSRAGEEALFQTWHQTPLVFGPAWPAEISTGKVEDAEIGDFLRRFWPETTSSLDLEQQATRLLHQPGNFYSFDGEHRMLVVAPAARRVVFAFSE